MREVIAGVGVIGAMMVLGGTAAGQAGDVGAGPGAFGAGVAEPGAKGPGGTTFRPAGAARRAPEGSSRPNFVFILADDLGWADLGCYGSAFYRTPNLDALARRGMRFTRAYASGCVCSPTRASLMTGKSPARLHLTDWLPGQPPRPYQRLAGPRIVDHLPPEEVTIAEALREGGYATALVGKWHLGGGGSSPERRGFDVNVGGSGAGHPPSYFSPYHLPALADGPEGEYLTDRLTDEAIRFIERSRDGPFLLYVPYYAVHTPLQAKPGAIRDFRARLAATPRSPGPEFLEDLGRQVRQVQDRPVYAAMLQALDEGVGRIVARLAELGLTGRTVVIFTSDNGGLSTAEGSPTSNLPLRGGKGWLYEGGIREPLLVSWPGVTEAGRECAEPVVSADFYPTLLEMAGLPPRPRQHLDGVSLVPLLRGEASPPRPPRFWHYPHYSPQGGPPAGAVLLGDTKLLEWYEDLRCELYDLRDDLGEHHDLAAARPETVADLRRRLHDWRRSVGAEMPAPNPGFRPDPARAGGAPPKPARESP